MRKYRLAIDIDAKGLSGAQVARFQAGGFELLANLERDVVATWKDEERLTPGRRYLYVVVAENEADAETKARAIVGSRPKIRVTPHRQRATGA